MQGLQRKIDVWVAKGLLSASQAESILEFETSGKNSRPWALYGIVGIGIAAIAIGVVSIIAANWDAIPPLVKLLTYLGVQSTVGYFCYQNLGRQGVVREGLITLFALLFYGGIGLVAQIYHIQSNGWGGILFWGALTLPIVLHAQSRMINYLWVANLIMGHGIFVIAQSSLSGTTLEQSGRYFFTAVVSLYAYYALGIFKHPKLGLPRYFQDAFRDLSFLTLFIGGSILGTFIWYDGTGAKLIDASDKELVILKQLQYAPWVGTILVAIPLFLRTPPLPQRLASAVFMVFVSLALFVTQPLFLNLEKSAVGGTAMSIAVWSLAAAAAAIANRRKLFDLLSLAITLRLLVVYFEVLGSMMATGIGLIISGLLVLGTAWLWIKFRSRLAQWIQQS